MCYLRLKGKFKNISIINIYASTNRADDEIKDEFYETLEEWSKIPAYGIKITVGDANAKIGRETSYKRQQELRVYMTPQTKMDFGCSVLLHVQI